MWLDTDKRLGGGVESIEWIFLFVRDKKKCLLLREGHLALLLWSETAILVSLRFFQVNGIYRGAKE